MLIWNKIWNKVHTINCYPKNIFQSKTFHNRSIDYHNEQNISNFNVATNRIVDLSFRNLVAFLNTASGSLVPSDNTENQVRVDGEMKKHYIY